MRWRRLLLPLLAVACVEQAPAAGGATSDEAVERWTEAIRASDFDTAARTFAPGYRERWLVRALALMPTAGMADSEVRRDFVRMQQEHGFTLDGFGFRDPLEEQHLEAIRQRTADADSDALLADVLRSYTEMVGRLAAETGYPEDRGRTFDVSGWVSEGIRTVEVDGRWFVVLPLPTSETR